MTSHYNQCDTNLYHAIHSDLVGELLHPPRAPSTPEPVKRFREAHYADPGTRTYHWGVACDPRDKQEQVHGTKFGTQTQAPDVVNPPVPGRPFRELAAARRLTYDSELRRPVGSVPLRQPAIPPHLASYKTTFGRPTKYGDTVKQCVSPFRTMKEFEEHWCKGGDLYRQSHNHLHPGEQVRRKYGPTFNPAAKMGVPTPNDPTGRRVRECVTWPGPCNPLPPIVSERAENWRELNQDRVGKSLDRFQCTQDLPSDFTYGSPFRHVLSGALDIATARTSCSLPPDDLARLDLILNIRRRLQAADFCNFIALLQTMKNMDKLSTKKLPLDSVLEACCQQRVPLSPGELRQLAERLNLTDGPRQMVVYALFVATLNWKDRLTLGHIELLRRDRPPVTWSETTSCSTLRPPPPDWCVDRKRQQAPGEPPQTDAGPRRQRVVDVVRPTPFIEAGLPETELTQPRSEAFLMELLCGMGVCDYAQFQRLYAEARCKHPPDPSVLDILDVANRSCCRPPEPEPEPARPKEPEARICARGLEEVKAVAESRTCRGTDQFAITPASVGGEKKLRFAESALEACGRQLPRDDPACATDFLPREPPPDTRPVCDPAVQDGRPPCPPPVLPCPEMPPPQPPAGCPPTALQ